MLDEAEADAPTCPAFPPEQRVALPSAATVVRPVGMMRAEQHDERQLGRRYFSAEWLSELVTPVEQPALPEPLASERGPREPSDPRSRPNSYACRWLSGEPNALELGRAVDPPAPESGSGTSFGVGPRSPLYRPPLATPAARAQSHKLHRRPPSPLFPI